MMKQIFDWLREQIKDASFRPFNEDVVYEESVQNLINEAEAKWEDHIFRRGLDYRVNDVLPMLENDFQLYGTCALIKEMASLLGIKIVEVE